MKVRSRRRRFAVAGCCLLAGLLFFKSGHFTIRVLDNLQVRLEARLGRFLDERHGLFFLATMDGPHPSDAISRAPLHIRKAERSQGKVGDARRIDLDHNVFVRADLMGKLTNSATFAAWFRPIDTSRKQLLFNTRSHEDGFVLALENNALSLSVTTTNNGQVRVSCPFAGVSNRFTHVSITFSQSEAIVFQNGRKSCELPLKKAVGFPRKPFLYGSETFWPFEGDIDELAVWQRALDAREVAGVARARKGIRYLYEPWHARALATVAWLSRTLSPTYRVFDRLLPRRRVTASMAKDIPLFMVWPSKADERHFSHAHALSARNGFRMKKAAEFRRIDMAFEGNIVSLDLALDDVYSVGEPKRMAYVVRDPSRTVFGGSGLVRLYPPELHSVLHADASCALPLSAKFVRLYFGNVFQGVYVVESFDREGGSWMAYGTHIGLTNSIGYRERSSVSDDPPPGAARDAAFSRVTSIVASDVFFPWSRQEILARCREREIICETQKFNLLKNHFPRDILNGNLSPLYVTGDLNLQGNPHIRWESSAPDIVSASGKVTRPVSGPPRAVVLTPVDIRRGPRKPVRIRVISQKPSLQALFLHLASPVDKYTRNDFSCLRMPAGGGEGEWFTGTAATGGGAHHRGNTSYIKGVKRSLSLKFDEPVAIMEDQLPARHVFLFCGYADPSRLRNRISFDAYRTAAGGRTPNGITAIDWAEVFINGEYFGVWELAHRIRDLFGADEGLLFKIRSQHPQLWTIPLPDMAEAISPPDIRSDSSLPLTGILKTVADTKKQDFPDMAHRNFIFDSLVDYFLMLNFTQNYDGQVVNQYLAKDYASGKWFVIPWDYDKTFFNADPAILSNRLVTRLWTDAPEFRRECRAKWKALRADALSDEVVLSRIDAHAELLAPYMEEEYRLKQPAGWTGDFPAAIDKLKETVSARLKALDLYFSK